MPETDQTAWRPDVAPLIRFILGVGSGAIASTFVLVGFRLSAWIAQRIFEQMPVAEGAPSSFLAAVLSWGGAVSAAATFVVVTASELYALLRNIIHGRSG